MGLLREMRLEPASALLQREVQLRHDLVSGRDGLFRLGGVRHLRRAEVDEDDRGAEREALSAALLQAVPPPVDVRHSLRESAPARLAQEGHPGRESEDLDRLVGRKVSAIDDPDLDLEWVSRVDRGIPRERRGIDLPAKAFDGALWASPQE